MGQYSGNANWDAEGGNFAGGFLPDEYGIFTDPKTGKTYIGGQEVGRGLIYGGKHIGKRKGGVGAGRGSARFEQFFEGGSDSEMNAYRRAMDDLKRGKDLQTDRYKDNEIGGPGYRFSQEGGSRRRWVDGDGNTTYQEGAGGNSSAMAAYEEALRAWNLDYQRGPKPEMPIQQQSPSAEFEGMQKRQYEWWNETTNGMRGSARKSLMDLQSAGLDAQKMARNYRGWGAGRLDGPRKSNIDHRQSNPSYIA